MVSYSCVVSRNEILFALSTSDMDFCSIVFRIRICIYIRDFLLAQIRNKVATPKVLKISLSNSKSVYHTFCFVITAKHQNLMGEVLLQLSDNETTLAKDTLAFSFAVCKPCRGNVM